MVVASTHPSGALPASPPASPKSESASFEASLAAAGDGEFALSDLSLSLPPTLSPSPFHLFPLLPLYAMRSEPKRKKKQKED